MIIEMSLTVTVALGAYASARCIVLAKYTKDLAETQSRSLSLIKHLQESAGKMEQYALLMETLARDMQSTRSMATQALRSAQDIRARLPDSRCMDQFVPYPEMGRAAPSGETGSGPGEETVNG